MVTKCVHLDLNMQTLKKPVKKTSTTIKDKQTDDKKKSQEEKPKKTAYNASTPRNLIQRASAADIYQKTPKKLPGSSKDFKSSPMKDYLRSSPSSVSNISASKVSSKPKLSQNSVRVRTAKDLPFVNVTVNSPMAKRKLDLDVSKRTLDMTKTKQKAVDNRIVKEVKENSDRKTNAIDEKGDLERVRSKTRTLGENEVKQLTLDKIDNNEEMMNLKQKLVAKPKAFYVGLDDGTQKKAEPQNKSDEDISYEDDFESYESDFDSYHSTGSETGAGEGSNLDVASGDGSDAGEVMKEKDEENMLDSGSFDLREQRSAKSKPAAMEFIAETEEDKVTSLDEGFQEGSSVSSMRTLHVDVLDRPLFVDFNKSREQRRKKRVVDAMIQRAKDILSMVTLHEMPYTLFEMKPISYDLYMATFGRTNYTQVAVQTFDDGITEEVQTDEVEIENKWTQHPVKFSKSDVYLNDTSSKNNGKNREDYMSKFSFLLERNNKESDNLGTVKEYKDNPLRILLEQQNGAGSCEMLPYETYKNKLKTDVANKITLGKFLKRVENKVCHVLNLNRTVTKDVTKSSLPFSSGYVGITTNNVPDDMDYLKQTKISGLIFSEDKSNLILTVHRKHTNGILAGKSIVCLWDASVARTEPIKILVAIDNVVIGRFKGDTDGLLVAALEDGSIHLWDLSEGPTWTNEIPTPALQEVRTDAPTPTLTLTLNLRNSNAGYDQLSIPHALQCCAYTSSAADLAAAEVTDRAVGLEFLEARAQDAGRRVVGQVCSLQRLGLLIIWTIVQEKTSTHDSGKAYWSKMKLEKTQTISLAKLLSTKEINSDNPFNLNAGKRRLVKRKQEKTLARNFSRQKSAEKSDIDRPSSVASARRLPMENNLLHDWESGLVCGDLKIMQHNNMDRYLVAKNNGEVLSCTRSLGAVKVERLCVSPDTAPITCLAVSQGHFLAGTESGAVHLYSLAEARVLLTLDCRNGSPKDTAPRADFKGSFVDAPRSHSRGVMETNLKDRLSVSSVLWSRVNPCSIFTVSHEGALACWELTHSDIYPRHCGYKASVASMANDGTLALVTEEGEAQVHRLPQSRSLDYAQLFHRYLSLL